MCHRWIYRRAKLVTAGQKTPGAGLNVTGDPNKTARRKTKSGGFRLYPIENTGGAAGRASRP